MYIAYNICCLAIYLMPIPLILEVLSDTPYILKDLVSSRTYERHVITIRPIFVLPFYCNHSHALISTPSYHFMPTKYTCTVIPSRNAISSTLDPHNFFLPEYFLRGIGIMYMLGNICCKLCTVAHTL